MDLRALAVMFTEVMAGVEPSVRVPTCPEWTARDLAGHIGQGPRWAAEVPPESRALYHFAATLVAGGGAVAARRW